MTFKLKVIINLYTFNSLGVLSIAWINIEWI